MLKCTVVLLSFFIIGASNVLRNVMTCTIISFVGMKWSSNIYSFNSESANFINKTAEEVRLKIRKERMSHTGGWKRPIDDSLLLALERKQPKHIPVWIMRQAGRYLPEFKLIRSYHSFFDMCEDPYLASEVTLQPLRRYVNLSAAIIFSDILVVPKAMGMKIKCDSDGIKFEWKLKEPNCINRLNLNPNIEESLGYVFDAIYLTKRRLENRKPLIGFCGGPFTIFTYIVNGGGDKTKRWIEPKLWLYEHPNTSHQLLRYIADISIEYLVKQYDSGAEILQVFDTNAEAISPKLYEEFGAKYMAYIAEELKIRRKNCFIIGFPKGNLLDSFSQTKFDGFSFDEKTDASYVNNIFAKKFTLQGNLDPHILYGSPETIKRETVKMIRNFGKIGYIATLGHGMEPDMNVDRVHTFIDTVMETYMNQM